MKARRDVIGAVAKAIRAGQTLKTYKTKARVGRKSVTLGPYREAVPGGKWRYSMVVGGDVLDKYSDSVTAAMDFIDYVGRDDAWDAAHGRGRERNPK